MTKVNTSQGASAYEVDVEVTKPGVTIKDGLSANLDIVTAQKQNVLAVPIESIVTLANGKSYVDLVGTDGTIQRTEVQTGISSTMFTEITSGLKAGDKVLLIPEGSTSSSSSTNYRIPGVGGLGGITGGEGYRPSGGESSSSGSSSSSGNSSSSSSSGSSSSSSGNSSSGSGSYSGGSSGSYSGGGSSSSGGTGSSSSGGGQ
jgi:hypothetical protein